MREEYDPLNASFPAHLSIFSHFDFVSLEAETQNIVFRLLKAESEVFDVDILTPMIYIFSFSIQWQGGIFFLASCEPW